MTAAWVVGASGLLGRAVAAAADSRPGWRRVPVGGLPWSRPAEFEAAVRAGARTLLDARSDAAEPWAVIWAAGAAVTNTSQVELDLELDQFRRFLAALADEVEQAGAGADGTVFYASSAGGVYSGSADPPFDETAAVAPLSPYGRFKLDAEQALGEFSDASGVRTVAGRIANLYGPGQRLEKMQGLISHIALAQLTPKPVSIYVSLDTLRDYLYVDDGAQMILDVVERAPSRSERRSVKNLASGRAVTIADLIGQFTLLLKRRPKVLLGSSAAAALQAHDLRIRSVVWTDIDARPMTPLIVGINETLEDLRRAVQRGRATETRADPPDSDRSRS